MRCKTCDYPLWNLKARQCPECGTPFLPSDFEFVINSVQFCCPDCNQAYYGTGERGHLVPNQFNCVSCGRFVSMNDLVLRPTDGVREEHTQVDRMPWLERKQRGNVKAWFQTVGKAMVNPISLMRGVAPESGVIPAWGFAIVTCVVFLLVGIGLPLTAIGMILFLSGDRAAPGMFGAAAVIVFGGLLVIAIVSVIWGALIHGILAITGGTEHGIGRTYQALLYSFGTNAVLAVPCAGPYCGTYFTWIWWAVSTILMIVHGQKVHGGRATLAVLSPVAVVFVLAFGGYLFWFMNLMTSFGGMNMARALGPNAQTAMVSQSLVTYAANKGVGPDHAVQLVTDGLGASTFVSSSTNTDAAGITIGETTLAGLDYLPPNRQLAAIKSVADSLPPDVVAHRMGDFVFTYHGIDWNYADSNLWIMIYWPDPQANPNWAPADQTYTVATVNGVPRVVTGNFAQELDKQNQTRALSQLPPLPDPATVTHNTPAIEP